MQSVSRRLLQPVNIKFRSQGGATRAIAALPGESLMRNARKHRVELESACDGTCTCTTCIVHFSKDVYAELPPPSEAESDMLDTAYNRLPNRSRLSCQVIVTEKLENVEVEIPEDE
mmetsp:Transcript_20438/g.31898  ORF Transcript_20438/g.31898 Transcript_20438/m.31898 type:complete len:116 (+) Transcript_20438:45-392(+)